MYIYIYATAFLELHILSKCFVGLGSRAKNMPIVFGANWQYNK